MPGRFINREMKTLVGFRHSRQIATFKRGFKVSVVCGDYAESVLVDARGGARRCD